MEDEYGGAKIETLLRPLNRYGEKRCDRNARHPNREYQRDAGALERRCVSIEELRNADGRTGQRVECGGDAAEREVVP